MPVVIPPLTLPDRGPVWKWSVCGLLLLATMVNYMDRQTLAQLADTLLREFRLDERHYGQIESAFAVAFAFGALVMGWLADRINVRWLYPAAVLVWSAAGFATGHAQGFISLLLCRFCLGLAESSNWPCALRTTQRILTPAERTMGNGILQSGAALGAFLTPFAVLSLYGRTGDWRAPFFAVGAFGAGWVVLWLLLVRSRDLALPPPDAARPGHAAGPAPWPPDAATVRRFLALVLVVVTINATWHFFRAWLPLFLQRQHGYSLEAAGYFTSAYYVATDLGSLAAGFVTLRLARRGMAVHRSRMVVFLACALLTSLSVIAAFLPPGPLLLGLLLVVGFGALGVFPTYYSFSQELTVRHQGKLTGVLSFICWMTMAGIHPLVGDQVARTRSYTVGVALAGLAPLVGFAALALLWGKTHETGPSPAEVERARDADERVRPASPDKVLPAPPRPGGQAVRKA
jgi:ACS family hexuronate transporter-like MFS transporter